MEMADIVTKDQLMKLSLEELDSLASLVSDTRKEKAVALRLDLKSRVESMIREAGVSIQELLGYGSDDKPKRTYNKKADGGAKTPVAPKFRHPENDSLTWSGRGRRPVWFADYEAKHGAEKAQADLLIKK
jgi:DNA-binding protein H-NS